MGFTNEEKLDFILKKSVELGVTAYEFSENTTLSAVGAHNILTGNSKKPRTRNLNIMMEYLINKSVGKKYNQDEDPFKNSVAEPDTLEDEIYKRIFNRLKPVLDSQDETIKTLRSDFKLLFDHVINFENKIIYKTNKNKKSS